MLRQASNWAVHRSGLSVPGPFCFGSQIAKTSCCCVALRGFELFFEELRTFVIRTLVFSNFLFLKTFVWSFVRAWSDITFCYRTSTFLFMNFLRTPVYSFVRTWRTLTFCSRIVISFLNFLFSNLLEFCVRGPERFFGKRKVCCRQKRIVLKSFGPCHSHGNRAA